MHTSFAHICKTEKFLFTWRRMKKVKLDGVGLVDNRPSTNKLPHFVKKKFMTCDT